MYLIIIPLLFAVHLTAWAQQTNEALSPRIGIHGGLQTSVFRYNVFPYTGDFQETAERSVVSGITFVLPIDHTFRLQVDIGVWSQPWSAFHDGDPKIRIERKTRSQIEFPVLLQYRFPSLPLPFHLAAGPAISLVTDAEKSYTVSYTGFTENEGWRTSGRRFKEETLHIAVVGEAGIEVPFSTQLSLQMAVRLTQPLGRAVDEQGFTMRELSVWRARLGLLLAL
jgi:hypothetical protein